MVGSDMELVCTLDPWTGVKTNSFNCNDWTHVNPLDCLMPASMVDTKTASTA